MKSDGICDGIYQRAAAWQPVIPRDAGRDLTPGTAVKSVIRRRWGGERIDGIRFRIIFIPTTTHKHPLVPSQ